MNKLLYPFSMLYSVLAKADRSFKKSKSLDKPVISVGNITWGGTGKTPVVTALLEFISELNLKPAVLTRGYGRLSKEPLLLKNGAEGINPSDSGDEPLLIARSVPSADIIVGADRYNNALKFEKESKADVFVLDDGFQHWKIKRDLDIVCINAANPFGNGMLIPAGILREKPAALKRAGLVIITNSDMVAEKDLEALKEKLFLISGKESVTSYYGGYEYKNISLNGRFDVNKFDSKGVYTLCGVGFSQGFKSSVENSGIKVKDCFVLQDHKKYDKKMIDGIFDKIGDSYLITTAKDAVKIGYFADDRIKEKTAVLTVKPVFKTGKEQWEKIILKSLQLS